MSDRKYIGIGQVAFDGLVADNSTTFELTVEKDEFELPNRGKLGGGMHSKHSRVKSIGFSATVHDYSADQLSELLAGKSTTVAAAAVADELMTAREGRLVATASVININDAVTITQGAGSHATSTDYVVGDWIYNGTHLYVVTVAGTTGGVAPTFNTDGTDTTDGTVTWADKGVFAAVNGTDFIASSAGIQFVTGKGIPDAAPVKVSYTRTAAGVVEMGVTSALVMPVIFNGINEKDNTPIVGKFHKVSISSDGGIPLITEGFGGATVTGTMLVDNSQPLGKSQFGSLTIGDTAII